MSSSPTQYLQAAALAALAGVGSFFHERPEQAGLDLNTAVLPAIIFRDYTVSQSTPTANTETAPVLLYFATSRPGQGDDPAAGNAAVAAMQALAARFMAALDSSDFTQIVGLKANPFYNAYAAELDGVGFEFTLTVPAASLHLPCPPLRVPA
jgi:hypothetical protein